MLITSEILAKKYAAAYLRCYRDELSDEKLERLAFFERFLATHKGVLLSLTIPTLTIEAQTHILQKMADHFHVTEGLQKLIALLIRHKRLVLLRFVLRLVHDLYYQGKGIIFFTISSSHALSAEEKQQLLAFTHSIMGSSIQVRAIFAVEPEMIAGIRIKSDIYLWERSINKLLHQVQQTMIQRVGL